MKKILLSMVVVLLFAGMAYAAPGDLTVQGNLVTNGSATVNGQLSVGAQGVKFADGTIQTTTKILVWDYTVTGTSVPSVTSPTLDGNAHGGYEMEFIIYNSSGGSSEYSLYYNNDQVGTHYYTKFSDGGWQNNARFIGPIGNNSTCIWRGPITITTAGAISTRVNIDVLYNTLAIYLSHNRTAIDSNLTSVSAVASVASGIGVGSRFRLWKKL